MKINYKEYIEFLKPYLIFSLFIFIASIFSGYFLLERLFDKNGLEIINELQTFFTPLFGLSQIELFFHIFIRNTIVLFLTIFLGIGFAFFPFIVLVVNGILFGVLMMVFKESGNLSIFFTGVLPHGIIEIPVMIFAGAIGIRLGKKVLESFFKKKELKKEVASAFIFFIKILFPLIGIAALVEVFITGNIINLII